MLEQVFLQVLNMSFTASFVILFVLVVRLCLKRAPKIYSYGLWSVVLLRLAFPFSFESVLSLLPTNAEPIPTNILDSPTPEIDTGIRLIDQAVNQALPAPVEVGASVSPMQVLVWAGSLIWIVGIGILLIYSMVKLAILHRNLQFSIQDEGNIYLVEGLETPFVMGLIHPQIYLPSGLSDQERRYILLHEQTHIRRKDHIVKVVGFLLVCLHWFNPLVWLAFFLSSKDMEMSCDESVIKKLGSEAKRGYSATLLALATGRTIVGGSPLAFGEGNTKGRIKNVLGYRKPAFWAAVVALIAVIAVGVGLLTNPREEQENPSASQSQLDIDTMLASVENMYQGYNVEMDGDRSMGDRVLAAFLVQLPPEGEGDPPAILVGVDKETGEIWQYGEEGEEWFEATPHFSEEAFIQNLFQSITFENGTVAMTIPADIPDRYQLFLHVSGTAPMGDGSHMSLHAFEGEEANASWEPGKTYQQELFSGDVIDGTELYFDVSFTSENGEVLYSDTLTWIFEGGKPKAPVSLWDTSVQFILESRTASLTYREADGNTFQLQLELPEDWELRLILPNETTLYAPVAIYRGDEQIGTISYCDFELYEGTTAENFYRSVYNQLMLGSMVNWDNEYTPVTQTETTCTATVQIYHREGDASGEVWYNPGILSYNTELLRYVAISINEGAASDSQIQEIARSLTLTR